MRAAALFPRPTSWLSAVLLYFFLGLWIAFASIVLPRIFELRETSPRLAALGLLGLWLSPVPFVAVVHHFVHAFLDRADPAAKRSRGLVPGLESLWAGVFAWFVIMLVSSSSALLLLVLFPPPPPDSLVAHAGEVLTSLAWPLDGRARAGLRTVVWILLAAQLYDLDRAVKQRAARLEP